MLLLRNIDKRFTPDTPLLCGAALGLARGQAVCIAGANAAGKTTLLRIAAGELAPDAGSVETAPGTVCALLPQQPALLPALTVHEHLRLWYAAQGQSGPHYRTESFEHRLGLDGHRRTRAERLSGGMRQRLSLCCLLLQNADALLLDEPFAALDAATAALLHTLLREQLQQGKGVLFVSHEPQHICALADAVCILAGGALSPAVSLTELNDSARLARVTALLFAPPPA